MGTDRQMHTPPSAVFAQRVCAFFHPLLTWKLSKSQTSSLSLPPNGGHENKTTRLAARSARHTRSGWCSQMETQSWTVCTIWQGALRETVSCLTACAWFANVMKLKAGTQLTRQGSSMESCPPEPRAGNISLEASAHCHKQWAERCLGLFAYRKDWSLTASVRHFGSSAHCPQNFP